MKPHTYRHYDPRIGRFISSDPIGFGGGDTNLYRYAYNNGIIYADPSGEFIPVVYIAIGVGAMLWANITNAPESAASITYPDESISAPIKGAMAGYTLNAARVGQEIKVNKDLRVAPFGNRTGNRLGRFPHYHRRVFDPKNPSNTLPGQGIGRHRPWEIKSTDTCPKDRF